MELHISDAARAKVGKVLERATGDPVSLRHLREYLIGTDDRELFYGLSTTGPIMTPPLFFFAAMREVVYESDLHEDGQHKTTGVEGITGRTLEGGTAYKLHHPLFVGDVLTMEKTLSSIEEKHGRSGPMAVVITDSTYTNQRGELVAELSHTIIFR
jgi:hydroxyacyl-ACP dehydratase HTD2-like protein with hotdog domain